MLCELHVAPLMARTVGGASSRHGAVAANIPVSVQAVVTEC